MYYIYMDSGTSNTRAYLVKDYTMIDMVSVNVGTKDSSITGSNKILLCSLKECCNKLLEKNHLSEKEVESIWASGMVTNPFGIVEVAHVSTPVDGQKLLKNIYIYYEEKYFKRTIYLICGAKTAKSNEFVTMDTIEHMNNVRGEEIEVVGMVAEGVLPKEKDCVMISPGSHTHILHVVNGAVVDIVSNFTGELNYAVKKDTILAGELSGEDVPMTAAYVQKGYEYLKNYGICRALYIIHATRVFETCSNEVRSQMMAGIIAGSVIELLGTKIKENWTNAEKIVIIGGKNYVESYRILCESIILQAKTEIVSVQENKSFALSGFLELLRLKKRLDNLQEGVL